MKTTVTTMLFFVLALAACDAPGSGVQEAQTMSRADSLKNQFSTWDGSHLTLNKQIKYDLDDPASYQHEKTVYRDKGAYLEVITRFRANNKSGALSKYTATARVDNEANILEINYGNGWQD